MDTSTSQERKKREIHSLGTKTREIDPPRPQEKTQKPADTGPSGHEKGGQRKSVPLHMVELGGFEPASTSLFRAVLHV